MSLFLSGLAGYSSEKVETSLTWTGGHTTGKGERYRSITTGHTCQSLTERSERPKGVQLLAFKEARV